MPAPSMSKKNRRLHLRKRQSNRPQRLRLRRLRLSSKKCCSTSTTTSSKTLKTSARALPKRHGRSIKVRSKNAPSTARRPRRRQRSWRKRAFLSLRFRNRNSTADCCFQYYNEIRHVGAASNKTAEKYQTVAAVFLS